MVYRYLDPASPEEEAEVQAGELSREPGCEAERAVVLAHATEPGHRGDPGSGQGGQVDPVAGVVVDVIEVKHGGLAEVVVGQFEVTDLGCDHRLDECGQRGVSDGQDLVVIEVAPLLLCRERVPPQVQRSAGSACLTTCLR